MKIAIIYFWTIVMLPFLFFIKGDLSLDTMTEIGGYNFVEQFKELVGDTKTKTIVLKVDVKSDNENFTGDGLAVKLVTKDYLELAMSQVINGRVVFTVKESKITDQNVVAVCALTNDEVKFNLEQPVALVINN